MPEEHSPTAERSKKPSEVAVIARRLLAGFYILLLVGVVVYGFLLLFMRFVY